MRLVPRPLCGPRARLARALALAFLLLGVGALPLASLIACATPGPESAELPKQAPVYREDRAEDEVDEECPECPGPGDATIPQEEEE